MPAKIHTIFVVDYKNQYLSRFKKLFENLPHLIYYCSSISMAKALLKGVSPDIFISRVEPGDKDEQDFVNRIQANLPSTIRIVYSREYTVMDLSKMVVSGTVHRYISLIWDKETVAKILQRDLLTRTRLRTSRCKNFFEKMTQIPTLPAVFIDIQEELRDSDCSIKKLVSIIERDPVISSRMLQIVNSAAFHKNQAIVDLHHAVTFLGVNQIRELVLFIYALQLFPPYGDCLEYAAELSNHSLLCSRLAAEIATTITPENKLGASTAALLHDLGKLIFYSTGCSKMKDSTATKEAFNLTSSELEQQIFGISHAELGSFLMLWWNLPMDIVETVANHTLPLNKLWGVPLCVAIADRCLLEAANPNSIETDLGTLENVYPVAYWRKLANDTISDSVSGNSKQ
jgi:putative nucleotidyltransferase with HDIG domain